jgi:ClpP class serine protease
MQLPHIATQVFDAPLLVTPHKLRALLGVLGPRFGLDGIESHLKALPEAAISLVPRLNAEGEFYDDEEDDIDRRRTNLYQILPGGVALIPIVGTLVHRGGWIGAYSGMTTYQYIAAAIAHAVQNKAVTRIIGDFDTHGGEAAGCFDVVDMIYEMRGQKPMTAIINECAYSAGYALASAFEKIIVNRTGGTGSIGVIATHVDQSEHDKQEGYKVIHIIAGAKKADFSPHKPATDEMLGWLQGMVNDTYDIFVKASARNRNISEEAIRKTEAGIFIGRAGIAHGLADEMATPAEAINREVNEAISNRRRKVSMSDKTSQAFAALVTAATAAGIQTSEAAISENPEGFVTSLLQSVTNPDAAVLDAMSAQAKNLGVDASLIKTSPDKFVQAVFDAGTAKVAEQAQTEMTQRMKDIKAAARQANRPEMALDMIIEGLSVQEAKERLLANLSSQERIDSGLDPEKMNGNTQPQIDTFAIYQKRNNPTAN